MEKRAGKARRLLNVLQQLHRIEELKRLELQRRYDELELSQREVIHSLNTDDALHGLFIDHSAKFLKTLAQEAKRVAEAREHQSRKLRERATKVKTAERLKDTLEQAAVRSGTERELRDIIERYTGRRGASLP
jgi:hypothetical protein